MDGILRWWSGGSITTNHEEEANVGECAMSRARSAAAEVDDDEDWEGKELEALLASSFQQTWTYAEKAEEQEADEMVEELILEDDWQELDELDAAESLSRIEIEHEHYAERMFDARSTRRWLRSAILASFGIAAAAVSLAVFSVHFFSSAAPTSIFSAGLAIACAVLAAWERRDEEDRPLQFTCRLIHEAALQKELTFADLGIRLGGAMAASISFGLGIDEASTFACCAGAVLACRRLGWYLVLPTIPSRDEATLLQDIESAQGGGLKRRLREAAHAELCSDITALACAKLAAVTALSVLFARFGRLEAGIFILVPLCFDRAVVVVALLYVCFYWRIQLLSSLFVGIVCAAHASAILSIRHKCQFLKGRRARIGVALTLAVIQLVALPVSLRGVFGAVAAAITPGGLISVAASWGHWFGGRAGAAASISSLVGPEVDLLVIVAFGASPRVALCVLTSRAILNSVNRQLEDRHNATVREAACDVQTLPPLSSLTELAAALADSSPLYPVVHDGALLGVLKRGVAALVVATRSSACQDAANPIYAPYKSPPLSVAAMRLERVYRDTPPPTLSGNINDGVVDLRPHLAPPPIVVYASDRLLPALQRLAALQAAYAVVLDDQASVLGLLYRRTLFNPAAYRSGTLPSYNSEVVQGAHLELAAVPAS